jgi:fermentation-respiration switch protein FrsA (DUF1100 family)
LVTYLLVVLIMTFLESWLVYPVPPFERSDWQPAGLDYEDVWMASADGTRLQGGFVPHPDPMFAVLYCHGNGEHVADNGELAAELRDRLQASVLVFDYRGYGQSDGKPHEAGLIADGVAAQKWLAERMGMDASETVVMGRSIGSGVAVAVAADHGARALIIECAFSRLTDVAAMHYPWLPVRLVMRNRFDSIGRIERYSGPLLQSHGTADRIVPIELAHRLFDAAPTEKKQFVELPGRGHNDYPPSSYYGEIATFLQRL